MGLGALQYFQSPEMTESSIKKGQYITVERSFFSFFYTKIKKIQIYHIIYILCFMLRDHWKRTHRHSNQRNAPFITLTNLIVNITRIDIQISFNINSTSRIHRIKTFYMLRMCSHSNQGFASVSNSLAINLNYVHIPHAWNWVSDSTQLHCPTLAGGWG